MRVLGSRIIRVCDACMDVATEADESSTAAASPPAAAVQESPLSNDRATVIPAAVLTPSVRVRAHRHWLGAGSALLLIAALPVVALALSGHASEESVQAESIERVLRPQTTLLSLHSGEVMLSIPERKPLIDGQSWVHPVAGTDEQVPTKRTRLFRATRPGKRASECGQGHCGVDLDAPRGSPVIAVRPGVVVKAMRKRDASGGLYVWVRHEDVGLRTEYFHLDEVAPGLRAGARVEAGQWLGTLGRTGIAKSQPHLHFAVRDVKRGLRYVDPKPWLVTAKIIDVLDFRVTALR